MIPEAWRKFIIQHGAIVHVIDGAGQRRRLGKSPDSWEIAVRAEWFRCEGKWLRRPEFDKLVLKRLAPGHAMQIPTSVLAYEP